MTCDYCDEGVPVVCRACGSRSSDQERGAQTEGHHAYDPVHRIEDPEGIEGTAVVPCGRSE